MNINESQIADACLQKALNIHGFTFKEEVLSQCKRFAECGKSRWAFEVAEFPVKVGKHETLIDFILKQGIRSRNYDYYILAIGEQTNPKIAGWCFSKSAFIQRRTKTQKISMEYLCLEKEVLKASVEPVGLNAELYNRAFAFFDDKNSNHDESAISTIENVFNRIIIGLNGIIDTIKLQECMLLNHKKIMFIPVIFTTATLWIKNAKCAEENVSSENLDDNIDEVTRKDWIWYRHHLPQSYKHSVQSQNAIMDLKEILCNQYARCIAIVNQNGIEDFLSQTTFPV